MRIVFRVDGNRHIGLGHVFRCLTLARALRAEGAAAVFVGRIEGFARDLLAREFDVVADAAADAAVIDLIQPDPWDEDLFGQRDYPLPKIAAEIARFAGIPRLVLSDRIDRIDLPGERIVAPAPDQRPETYPEAERPRMLLGPEYHVAAPSFLSRHAGEGGNPIRASANTPAAWKLRLAAFFGGHDHCDFAGRLLAPLLDLPIEATLILGAATPDPAAAAARFGGRVTVLHALDDLAPAFAAADVVLAAAGTTLFDLAAMGKPTLAVATRPRQRRSLEWLAAKGGCVDLGDGGAVEAVRAVLDEPARLGRMAAAARAAIDGRGADRIVRALRDLAARP